jgi:LuxR family transcriptional regulator, maltose regulon positive regulatory protein
MKRSQLAKLTRPRLHNAVARGRLFRVLDEAREHKPAICIVGPPGAGKTTLVASWLDARGIKGIWYQVDPGDADLATFFYYLGEAARQFMRKGQRPLPLLTPEYLQDLEGFSRRFFRELFSRLPDNAILILDNYQEVLPEQRFHQLIAQAVDEVPGGMVLIAISRRDPPDAYARLVANENVQLVEWDALKLTLEEARAIAGVRSQLNDEDLGELHEKSGGWAAGLTLLLEIPNREGNAVAGLEKIFDYFASQIFDRAPGEIQRFLVTTAFLPRVTVPVAEALTGNVRAGEILDDLYGRHLFMHRRPGEVPTYQYHALFQQFLRSQALRCFEAEGLRRIKTEAAALLKEDQPEAALDLYVEASAWDEAARIIVALAPKLIAQGRWQTLQEWVHKLPEKNVRANPFVRYWLGCSKVLVDPVAARPVLANAFQTFLETGNELWQILCSAAILEAICYEFSHFPEIDRWLDHIAPLFAKKLYLPTVEDELRLHSAIVMAATIRAPEHPLLAHSVARVEELLMQPLDVNLKLAAATMLHFYSHLAVEPVAERIASQEAAPLVGLNHAAPIRTARFLTVEGYTHYMHGRYDEALSCFDRAIAITAEHRLDDVMLNAEIFRALCQCRAGMLEEAAQSVHRLEMIKHPLRDLRIAPLCFLKGILSCKQGRAGQAREYVLETLSMPRRPGMFVAEIHMRIICANILVAAGDYAFATELLQQARAGIVGPVTSHFAAVIEMNQAWLAHRQGCLARRDELLREALRSANDDRSRMRLRWYENALSELLPIALTQGIEPDIARNLAREFDVRPESLDIEEWPWPVKVYTLGRFGVVLHEKPLRFSRKTPRRLIGLLKALVSFGAHEVPEQRLIDALWPDEEGDAARHALTVALHRLRRLLGDTHALRVENGRVSLNRERVWIDALEVDRVFAGAEAALARGDQGAFDQAVKTLGLLYRGQFLPADTDAPWSVSLRERLKAGFVQFVTDYGEQFESSARWDEAADWYRRGLAADDLSESFYQGLMRCYLETSRCAEGLSVFRRMRQILSVTLGIQPSPRSEALHRSLQSR